jgi:hypothetical protein
MTDKPLMATTTGEPLQLARIYYTVVDRKALLRKFNQLSCVYLDSAGGRWVWEYSGEAVRLQFQTSRNALPPQSRNVVLGSFYFKQGDELVLDVRSFDRVTKAIVFFDQRISAAILRVNEVGVVNRLFSKPEDVPASWDVYFNRPDVIRRDPEAMMQKVAQLKEPGADTEQLRMQLLSEMIEDAKSVQPEIERFPANYYEGGIEQLEMALRLRFMQTWEHWKGNKNYSFNDLMKKILGAGVAPDPH